MAGMFAKAAELRDHIPQRLCWSRMLSWSVVHVMQVLLLLHSTYSSAGDSVNIRNKKNNTNKYKKHVKSAHASK